MRLTGPAVFVALLVAIGFAACSGDRPAFDEPPDLAPVVRVAPPRYQDGGVPDAATRVDHQRVVLIVVDTLRADRMGCYGYEGQTTPTMDRFAREGVLFEQFHASSPWTAPSFGSMLTGVSPTVHRAGKRLRKGAKPSRGKPGAGVRITRLTSALPTLPELLGAVPSGAVVTNSYLHPELGFGRGFDHYDHRNAGYLGVRDARATTDAAVTWLEQRRDGDFFLLVHYIDPHVAYDPPDEYVARFAPGPSGRFEAPFRKHTEVRNKKIVPTPEELAFIKGLYDGELRFVDDQIALLRGAMERFSMLDDTWIVITSDHGEEHLDHGGFEHGHRYEEEVTRVPLIIRAPGGRWQAGTRNAISVRHVDLPATVLDLFGLTVPGHFEGRSVLPLIRGEDRRHRSAYMEYNLYQQPMCALFDGRYKIVHRRTGAGGFLYDLAEDPLELNKLGPGHPRYRAIEESLRRELHRRKANAVGVDEPVRVPLKVEQSLRALGYLE